MVELADVTWQQWAVGALAALAAGCAKTGVPGLGILVVPLMAAAFGGKPSVGVLLPLLIFADCFAVAWYRRHARWDRLWGLFPAVVPGMALGAVLLWAVDGALPGRGIWFEPLIGAIVIAMLALMLVRRRLGDRVAPHGRLGVLATGASAGAATTLANAAGPIMIIYCSAMRLPKEEFLGTNAWFFLILNCSKVPIYLAITALTPENPMITWSSLAFDACLFPGILLGAFAGRWLLPRMHQLVFDWLVLALAAIAAVRLVVKPWLG